MDYMERIKQYAKELAQLQTEEAKLDWVAYTAGYDFGVDDAYKKIIEYLKDKERFQTVEEARQLDNLSLDDQRRVELLYREFEPFHLSDEINSLNEAIQAKSNALGQVLNTFRFTIGGDKVTSVEIAKILMTDADRSKRQEAYEARAQINEPLVEAGFLELVELRKKLAKKRGFTDFVAMKLYDNELPESLFEDWKEQLAAYRKGYDEIMERFAKEYLDDDTVYPWDIMYVQGQIASALNAPVDMMDYYGHVKALFEQFGFDLDKYPITYDIFPRANKSEWGYNFPIEKGKDSRILANVKNQYSEFEVLLHETGHGVHHFLKDPAEDALDLGVSGIITEGIANMFGHMIYEPIFYNMFFEAKEVEEQFGRLKEWKEASRLRALTDIFFDHELYRRDLQNNADIEGLYTSIQQELFGTKGTVDRVAWGYRIHHTTHPIYLHNYFMGDVTAELIKKAYENQGQIGEEGFGTFLKESIIDESGRYTYIELLDRLGSDGFKF